MTGPPLSLDSRLDVESLVQFTREHHPLCVITGAGCSTGSGIFDYRDVDGKWKRPPPVLLDEFLTSMSARRRYWARSMLGWRQFSTATPNVAHRALARLEKLGFVTQIITQNVDDLHESAGQKNVIPLHGSLRTVTCVDCQKREPRSGIQAQLEISNPRFVSAAVMPDAGGEGFYAIDVDDSFAVPNCSKCGGILKPDVVFFGGNIESDVKRAANEAIRAAAGVLVVGTSLMVYSSFRLVKLAHELSIPVASLGYGVTREDSLMSLMIRREIASTFEELIECLQV